MDVAFKTRPIPGFKDRYLVASDGRVFSKSYLRTRHGGLHRGQWLKPVTLTKGYLGVRLAGELQKVHRLVAEAFIPNRDQLPCVNHLDGDKANNSADNLEWCTGSGNTYHAYRTGLMQPRPGEGNPAAKLTWDQVREIRTLQAEGVSQAELGRIFGVHQSTIYLIVHGKHWAEAA